MTTILFYLKKPDIKKRPVKEGRKRDQKAMAKNILNEYATKGRH